MKILIAPSKGRNYKKLQNEFSLTIPIYNEEASYLQEILKQYKKDEIASIFKIKNKILDRTYNEILNFERSEINRAIFSFNGVVYKELDLSRYTDNQFKYLSENVIILSALYGIIKPFDGIKNYRLDMTIKFKDITLYKFWENKINSESINRKENEIVVNLASNEYKKMFDGKLINIKFLEKISEFKYKQVSIYSKKARGKILNYMILNKIDTIDEIKKFNVDNYRFSEEESDLNNIVFIRWYIL